MEVTIVGAGVAGCSLGHFLDDRGHDVTIVERDAVGGMLREIEFDSGQYCDSAPHILFFEDEESRTKRLFSKFSDLASFDPYAKSYPREDLSDPHDYPVSRKNAERWEDTDKLYEEIDRNAGDSGETFDEFVVEQVGPKMYERYFENYTAKQWGVDPGRIVGDWFDYKVAFPETERPFFGDANAYYPDQRYKTILEDMISECDLVYEGVTGLVRNNDRVEAVRTESGKRIEGDMFVNTIDPTVMSERDHDLQYRSMVIVGVRATLECTRLFPQNVWWGYFPNHYQFTRLTDYGFTGKALGETSILTFEFPCFLTDEVWSRDSEYFHRYLSEFFTRQDIENDIHEVVLRKVPRAYPLPIRSERETFERVNKSLDRFSNLYNLGRVSTYQYIWIKDIIDAAYDLATEIDAAAARRSS
jgi:UDP-galactopyranose mutase